MENSDHELWKREFAAGLNVQSNKNMQRSTDIYILISFIVYIEYITVYLVQ